MATDDARCPAVALLSRGDRFEDFHDKIGISLETFQETLTGTWLFNYVEALRSAGLRPVLYFVSAHVRGLMRLTHRPTGTPICVVPAPWLHRKLQGTRDRLGACSPQFSSLLSYAATPWRSLARELRRDGCEAILCQEYEYPRFDQAVVLGRVLRIPVFATYQGGDAPGSIVELPFRGAAIRRAAGLIIGAVGEIDRVRAVYDVPPERIALVPNPLDVEQWRPADRHDSRNALGVAADARVVIWHGRVEIDKKGLDVLLDAWEQLYTRCPRTRAQLLLLGTGSDCETLRRRVASFPPGAVRWDDRWVCDPNLIRQYLSAADIATLSSRREGFPMAVLEAMACGVAVVATDVSGVIEAFGEELAGVVVPREDPAALAQAFERLLEDDHLRRELGERARRRAESEFSLQTVGGRLRAFMAERGAFRPKHP